MVCELPGVVVEDEGTTQDELEQERERDGWNDDDDDDDDDDWIDGHFHPSSASPRSVVCHLIPAASWPSAAFFAVLSCFVSSSFSSSRLQYCHRHRRTSPPPPPVNAERA